MKIIERVKEDIEFLWLIAAALVCWLAAPLEWFEAFLIAVSGLYVGSWKNNVGRGSEEAVGPALPWEEMHSGEKLAYFFPAIWLAVFGLIIFGVGVTVSRSGIEWPFLSLGVVLLIWACAIAYQNWTHRYD